MKSRHRGNIDLKCPSVGQCWSPWPCNSVKVETETISSEVQALFSLCTIHVPTNADNLPAVSKLSIWVSWLNLDVYVKTSYENRHRTVIRELKAQTSAGSHYFGIIYCFEDQHERKAAFSHVRDFLSNTSTHAHWLQRRNSDLRLTSVDQKRLCLSSLLCLMSAW